METGIIAGALLISTAINFVLALSRNGEGTDDET